MEKAETLHDDSKENNEDVSSNVIKSKEIQVQQASQQEQPTNQQKKKYKLDYKQLQNRQNFDLSDPNDMEIVKTLLKKQNTARTKADLEILYKAFNDNKFIKDMEKDVNQQLIRKMLKNMQFAEYKRREIIFNQGEQASTFYIIIQGSVWVLVPNKFGTAITDEQSKISKEIIQNPELYLRMPDEQFVNKAYPQFNQIATLKSGYSFGEIALRQQTVRTATVICAEDTLCASVSKEIFNSCISEFYKIQRDKEIGFLHQFHIFTDLYKQDVEMILMSCTKHQFNKYHVIYKENEDSDRIYFLQEGEIEVSKKSDIFTENANLLYVDRTKDLNMNELPFRNFGNQLSYKKTIKRIPVVKVCPNSMFGDEEAFNNKKRVTKAVVASNEATYYSLKIKDFYQIMQKKYCPEFIDELKKEMLIEKIKYRQEKLCKNIFINQMFNSFEQKIREETQYSTNKVLNTTEIIRSKKMIQDSEIFSSINNTAIVQQNSPSALSRNVLNSHRENNQFFITDHKLSLEKIRCFSPPQILKNESSQHLLSSSLVYKASNSGSNKHIKQKFINQTFNQFNEEKQPEQLKNQDNLVNAKNNQKNNLESPSSFQRIFKKIVTAQTKEKYPEVISEISYVSSPLSARRLQSAQCKRNISKNSQRAQTQLQHQQQNQQNQSVDLNNFVQNTEAPQQQQASRPDSCQVSPRQKIQEKIKKSNSLSQQQKKIILLSMQKQRKLNQQENSFYDYLENHVNNQQKQSIQYSNLQSPKRAGSVNNRDFSPVQLDSKRKQACNLFSFQENQNEIKINLMNQGSQKCIENQNNKAYQIDQKSKIKLQLNRKNNQSNRGASQISQRNYSSQQSNKQLSQTQVNFYQNKQGESISRSPTKEKQLNSYRKEKQNKLDQTYDKNSFLNVKINNEKSQTQLKKQKVLIMQPKLEGFQKISCYDQEYDSKLKELESDILNDNYVCDQIEAKLLMSLAVQEIIQKETKVAPIDNKNPLIDIDYVKKQDREAKLYSRKSMMQTKSTTQRTISQTPKNTSQNQKINITNNDYNQQKFPQNYMSLIIDQQREKCYSAMTSAQISPKEKVQNVNQLRVSLARSKRISVNPGRFYLKGDKRQQFYDDFKEEFQEKETQEVSNKTQETNTSDEYVKVKPRYDKKQIQFNCQIIKNKQKMEEFKKLVRSQLGKK
ncbi:cyclic nucleotide-binding domain protein (macronuclear) [Tetrahymena thermophila SB210]|uniref:Cyclic nucleotide-binding domain protein n=1 Tax=Tetrahymena thermophila (strain SB210) TaxID=312017 RepID=I7M1J6_TETTS|nr:cyclic nucleotide-binding domain protein [Tetrahymena thermophila SB210]EAR96468.2 cyclic nucleotide-binding domain protein [Tetrahymena thermophila SB210]|eukprot:XP_001016713.2 cyclic nucleotide-binding domain protein [Tetrahymena thermophila SB210]